MHPLEYNVESYPPFRPEAVEPNPMRERLLSDCFVEAFRRGDLREAWAVAFDMLRLQALEVGVIDCHDRQSDSQHEAEPPILERVAVSPLENWALILDATEQTDGRYLNPVQVWQEERDAGRSTSARSIEAMQYVLQRGLGTFRWVYEEGGVHVRGPMIINRDGKGRVLAASGPDQIGPTWSAVASLLNSYGYAEDGRRLIGWADENLGNGGEVVRWLLGAHPEEVSSYVAQEPMSKEPITPTGITGQTPADLSGEGLGDDWDQEWLTD